MMSKTVVLQAAPSVRTMCGPEMVEGQWRDIPETAKEIKFSVMKGASEAELDELVEEVTLVARPCGRMARRSSDNLSAPIWEIRHPGDW